MALYKFLYYYNQLGLYSDRLRVVPHFEENWGTTRSLIQWPVVSTTSRFANVPFANVLRRSAKFQPLIRRKQLGNWPNT